MLARVWLREEAQRGDNQGLHRSMDSRPFRPFRPRFALKAGSNPDPKLIQSKIMYVSRLSSTYIGCLHLCGCTEVHGGDKATI